jgi:predicted acetyltransferase
MAPANEIPVSPRLELVAPSLDYREDFLAMAREYQSLGEDHEKAKYAEAARDLSAFIRITQLRSRGLSLLEGQVPYHTYWLVEGRGTILAASTLRQRLTPPLMIEGGHVGYGTRPSQRRRGFGRLICSLTLQKAREMGLRRVLVTCNTENVASARIIQSCGGRLEGASPSPRTGKAVSRYWIDL